jgi:hypothetical protein
MTKDQTFVRGSVPLMPPNYELFAQRMAQGKVSAKTAYMELYPEASPESAETTGPKIFRSIQVQERVNFILGKALENVTMQVGEAISFLEEAIRTPVAEINEHSRLAHKKVTTRTPDGGKRVTVDAISKKDALDMLAKIAGWYKAEAPNEGGYVPTEEVAERVSQVALDNFGRRGDVAKVLAMFKKD